MVLYFPPIHCFFFISFQSLYSFRVLITLLCVLLFSLVRLQLRWQVTLPLPTQGSAMSRSRSWHRWVRLDYYCCVGNVLLRRPTLCRMVIWPSSAKCKWCKWWRWCSSNICRSPSSYSMSSKMAGADTLEYPGAIHLIQSQCYKVLLLRWKCLLIVVLRRCRCVSSAVGVLFLDLIILFCSSEAPPCANQLIVITILMILFLRWKSVVDCGARSWQCRV